MLGKGSSLRNGCQALEQAPSRSGHSRRPAGVQEVFIQHVLRHGLIFVWSSEKPGVGRDDPWWSLPAQDILQ